MSDLLQYTTIDDDNNTKTVAFHLHHIARVEDIPEGPGDRCELYCSDGTNYVIKEPYDNVVKDINEGLEDDKRRL